MKQFLLTILLILVAVAFTTPAAHVIGDLLDSGEPMAAQIKTGDWLSKLARDSYGDVSYWRELALVNRAPNPDLIFPEEEVVLPSLAAIRQIREARSLSVVNRLVDEQQAILAGHRESDEQPVAQKPSAAHTPTDEQASSATAESQAETTNGAVEPTSGQVETTAPLASEEVPAASETPATADEGTQTTDSFFSSTPVLTGLAIVGVILLIGAVMFIRNHRREKRLYEDHKSLHDQPAKDRSRRQDPDSDSFELTKHKQPSRARKARKEPVIQ